MDVDVDVNISPDLDVVPTYTNPWVLYKLRAPHHTSHFHRHTQTHAQRIPKPSPSLPPLQKVLLA